MQTLAYSYDAAGNQLTAHNAQGTYTLTYDAVNRVTGVQGLFAVTLTFTYDATGNRTLVQDSLNGVTTSTYDDANNLTSRQFGGTGQTPLRIDLTYDADNQVATATRYKDLAGSSKVGSTTYTYDTVNRLSNLVHRDGSGNVLANYTYTYDPGSRLTTEVLGGVTTSYTYDDSNEVTGDGTATFTFDGEGNRTNGSNSTGTGNQLTSDGTWTYTYDSEGNLTKKTKGTNAETWTYGYDNANHMTYAKVWSADPGSGGTLQKEVDYAYDAYGNRGENGDALRNSR